MAARKTDRNHKSVSLDNFRGFLQMKVLKDLSQ